MPRRPIIPNRPGWDKTVDEIRNLPDKQSVGNTQPRLVPKEVKWVPKVDIDIRPNEDGKNEAVCVVKSIEITLPIDIEVTVPKWNRRPKEPKIRQEQWDRFEKKIRDHENRHVSDVQNRIRTFDDVSTTTDPIVVVIKNPRDPKSIKAAQAEVKKQVKKVVEKKIKTYMEFFQAANEEDAKDFHGTREGRPIDPKVYFPKKIKKNR